MFDRIFADYLVETGKLSEQNVEVIFSTKEERRAYLCVIAVSEKLLTVDQAEEINQLQAIYDKKFGDIAIENEILTAEQVDRLRLEAGGRELAGAGREHLHSGSVGRSGIEPVGDLVCCGAGRGVAALGGRAGCPQGPKPEAAAAPALEPLWVALTSSAAPWGV